MGRLSEISLGDLTNAAARYRPVAVTVIAIAVLLALLPDRGGKQQPFAAQGANAVSGGPAFNQAGATTTTTAPAVDTATIAPTSNETTANGSSFTLSADNTSQSSSSGPSSSSSDSSVIGYSGPREAGDTGSDSGAGGASDSSTGSSEAADTPLTVAVRSWATATAGTPLGANDVPEHSLPVGRRFGSDDKRSYVRLTGTQSTLVLSENPDGTRSVPGSTASVKACPISDTGWKAAEGESFDEAPKYATDHCAAGQRSPDGNWSFDLSAYPSRSDDHGFALVPGDDAGIDFQVAFK